MIMAISDEITRLQQAKADLKTAIESKGVTVPSSTKLDGYADLVDSIEVGGGGSIKSIYNLTTGGSGASSITFVGDGTAGSELKINISSVSGATIYMGGADITNKITCETISQGSGWVATTYIQYTIPYVCNDIYVECISSGGGAND